MIYDVDYFIQKFEAIPDENFLVGNIGKDGVCCALGHCGGWVDYSKESKALSKVLAQYYDLTSRDKPIDNLVGKGVVDFDSVVYWINDGLDRFDSLGNAPKARILAALYDVKKLQSKDTKEGQEGRKEVIKYVAVSEEIRENANDKIIASSLTN